MQRETQTAATCRSMSALLTLHGVRPRPPVPRDFRFRHSGGVARQSDRVAFADSDVGAGQVVDDLRRNWTRPTQRRRSVVNLSVTMTLVMRRQFSAKPLTTSGVASMRNEEAIASSCFSAN